MLCQSQAGKQRRGANQYQQHGFCFRNRVKLEIFLIGISREISKQDVVVLHMSLHKLRSHGYRRDDGTLAKYRIADKYMFPGGGVVIHEKPSRYEHLNLRVAR